MNEQESTGKSANNGEGIRHLGTWSFERINFQTEIAKEKVSSNDEHLAI